MEALNGLTLSNIRAIEAPAANARNVNLPLGLFGFDVHGMAPGGAATVRLALPEGSALNHYFKQDSTGALQRFDFDGSTGAEFNGNVVTLHFVDGGRGDADGVANGVVVDPGGPGEIPLPYVRLKVLDPTAAKYRVDDVHGTSTGAFAVYRGGDLSDPLTVYYTVNPSSTAVAGQDYTALTGSVTIQPGQATAGILVRPLDNASGYSTKTVSITLSESPDYVVGSFGGPESPGGLGGDFGTTSTVVTISETSSDHPLPIQMQGDRPLLDVLTLDANAAELPGESSTGLMLVNRSALVTMALPSGGGTTWTNPAAVTAFYSVSQTGTASDDYEPLSGSVSLPYAVFAAEVKIIPIDDTVLEGPETVTVSLTPDASYYIGSPDGSVTIHDNEEPPVAPIANPDEFAMGAEDGSLSVPPAGVIGNDYIISPGPASSVLMAGPSFGTLVLNPNGSFVYTPNEAITDSGGDDSFQYIDTQNGLDSGWAIVTIHVVKVTITTPGLPHNANITTGAFVPINANNDNGSVVNEEVPTRRDFNVAPLWSFWTGFINDPDLIPVNVVVNPNMGLPGFFTISVANPGVGQIRLWREQSKQHRAEGAYTLANLPRTFYMEGFEPGAALRESVVTVRYVFIGANGLPMGAGADRLAATVTPVIDFFNIATGRVSFRRFMVGGVMQNVALDTVGPNQEPGAGFIAQVTRTGLGGNAFYIQNVMNVLNGAHGAAAGFTFVVAQGDHLIPNRNSVPFPVWDRPPPTPYDVEENAAGAYVLVPPPGGPGGLVAPGFPLLDMVPGGRPMPADYTGMFFYGINNANTQLLSAVDNPGTLIPFYPTNANVPPAFRGQPQHMSLTNIDVEDQFRVFLIWRFADGTRYTIAFRDWNVIFRATGPGAGAGLNAINAASGVFTPPGAFTRSHANPVVAAPIFNDTMRIL